MHPSPDAAAGLAAMAQPAPPPPAAGACEAVGPLAGICEGALGGLPIFTPLPGIDLLTGLFLPMLADGVRSLVDWLTGLILDTATVELGAPWFVERYDVTAALAAVVILPLALCGIIHALIRQDPGQLGRVVAAIPVSMLLTAAATVLIQALVALVDAASQMVAAPFSDDIAVFFAGLAELGTAEVGGVPVAGAPPTVLVGFSGLLIILGALGVGLELLVRSVAIYAAVLLLPIGFVALVWSVAARYAMQLVRVVVMLVISKFVIVAIISLSAAALAETGTLANAPASLAGGMMLLLAMVSPWVLLRVAPGIDIGIDASGPRRWAGRAAMVAGFATSNLIRSRLARRPRSGSWPVPPGGNP